MRFPSTVTTTAALAVLTTTAALAVPTTAAAAETAPESGAPADVPPAAQPAAQTAAQADAARAGPDRLARCAAAGPGEAVLAAPLGGDAVTVAAVAGRVERAGPEGWSELTPGGALALGDEVVLAEGAHAVFEGAGSARGIEGPALVRLGAAGGHACLALEEVRMLAQTAPTHPVDQAGRAFMAAVGIGAVAAIATEDDDGPPAPVSP